MAKISKENVWQMASEIDAEGGKPTVVEIRKRLGAGSYTTITAALREWIKPEEDDVLELDPMPSEVSDKIDQFGADLYAVVARHAAEKFEAERAEYERRIKEIKIELDESVSLADELEDLLQERIARHEECELQRVQALTNVTLLDSRVGDLMLDKERALMDAAISRQEVGVLRGRLDVYEAREVKPTRKKPAPVKSGSVDQDSGQLQVQT